MTPNLFIHLDSQQSFSQTEERLVDFSVHNAIKATIHAEGAVPVEVNLDDASTWYYRFDLKGRLKRKVTLEAWGSGGEHVETSTVCELVIGQMPLYPGMVTPPEESIPEVSPIKQITVEYENGTVAVFKKAMP